jgi:hypothetical protein
VPTGANVALFSSTSTLANRSARVHRLLLVVFAAAFALAMDDVVSIGWRALVVAPVTLFGQGVGCQRAERRSAARARRLDRERECSGAAFLLG